jgi:hypothetical protein
MKACAIKIEHARWLPAFAPGSVVANRVAEINPDAIAELAQSQAMIDIGLSLLKPRVKAANRT